MFTCSAIQYMQFLYFGFYYTGVVRTVLHLAQRWREFERMTIFFNYNPLDAALRSFRCESIKNTRLTAMLSFFDVLYVQMKYEFTITRQRRSSSSSSVWEQKKVKTVPSIGKVIATVFLDSRLYLRYEFYEPPSYIQTYRSILPK